MQHVMPVALNGPTPSEPNVKFRLTEYSSAIECYETRAFLNGRLKQLNNTREDFYPRKHNIKRR